MFESVEEMLESPDYDKDLQDELSIACPNYMTVFQSAKRDLLRNDCGIVVAGLLAIRLFSANNKQYLY